MKTKLHYDNLNNNIYVTDSFHCKDELKTMGFSWNSMDKVWFITCPADLQTLGNLICDVVVAGSIDYADLCDFMALSLPSKYIDALMHMDASHVEKLQTYLCA